MLALALLLGLIVWVLITLAAIFIGTKLGKSLYPDNPKAGLYGALSGFMLTMGGFIVYWAVEYAYIQTKVSDLCESEGGVTVYVTPEEYKKRVKNNNWKSIEKYKPLLGGKYRSYIEYEGLMYEIYDNGAVLTLTNTSSLKSVKNFNSIIYDAENEIVLAKLVMYSVTSAAIANDFSGLKFWMSSIDDCFSNVDQSKRFNLKKQYSLISNQE
ncbi:hypothetical protein [Psychrobacter sp. W2-37-MNA-CIBAN-0211]|uniref:hypothetical protein n=1 Tax=Psychrobacter sp. W2-37-MNA-CIBAN-0211 TaxID=3140443 RepID=UPI00331F674D